MGILGVICGQFYGDLSLGSNLVIFQLKKSQFYNWQFYGDLSLGSNLVIFLLKKSQFYNWH